jgi:hypothetical protein
MHATVLSSTNTNNEARKENNAAGPPRRQNYVFTTKCYILLARRAHEEYCVSLSSA